MKLDRKPSKGRTTPLGGNKPPKGRKPVVNPSQMRTFGKAAEKPKAMTRQAVRSKNPRVVKARAKAVAKNMAAAPKKRMTTYAKPKATTRPATQPKPTTPTITPRKVESGGQAIGAAHQSFFDIGKFLKSLGGGN